MKLLFFSVLILLVLACPFVAVSAQSTADSFAIRGLENEVTVRRDQRSIPYIEAQNLEDLYFAQGYETARDRLWQMDLMRRVARGRLAELFGKAVLEEDKRWRTFGFSEIADESVRQLSPKLKLALENYALGVNAYISNLDEKTLPVEFQVLMYTPEPWTPSDTIVVGKILADGLSTTWWQDINRVSLAKLPKAKFESITDVTTPGDVVLYGKDTENGKERATASDVEAFEITTDALRQVDSIQSVRASSLGRIGFYAEHLAASNNWVISGKRTIDGKAILANDPHLRPSAPGIWYLTHLSAPGMKAAGVTFPGVPGIVLGHNDKIAWGATNVGPDVQDIVFEEFNEKNEYLTPDGWKKAEIRKEVIRYRPSLISPKTVEEEIEVVSTRNGVIFREFDGKKAALKWTALNPSNQEFEAFISLNSANNWEEFREALSRYGGATQNFVYADTKGNIGWQVAGSIPIRRKGDGAFPYEGKTGDGDWIGTIPFDELPRIYNPPSGFIVTANQRIAGTSYKYKQLTRQIAGPWRARRIYELIAANKKISISDVSDIQHDVFNIPLSGFAREIVKRKAAPPEVIEILQGWDGKMDADSSAAVIANSINECVGNEIAAANKSVSGWRIRQFVLPFDIPRNERLWLPEKYQDWKGFLQSCSTRSLEGLKSKKTYGSDPKGWKWGVANKASFNHPLSAAPLIGGRFKVEFDNVNGSGQTPNVGSAVSMRFVAKPSEWDETRHVIPLGQSGAPGSTHWQDQFEFWRTGKPAVFPFSAEAVKAASSSVLKLMPAGKTD